MSNLVDNIEIAVEGIFLDKIRENREMKSHGNAIMKVIAKYIRGSYDRVIIRAVENKHAYSYIFYVVQKDKTYIGCWDMEPLVPEDWASKLRAMLGRGKFATKDYPSREVTFVYNNRNKLISHNVEYSTEAAIPASMGAIWEYKYLKKMPSSSNTAMYQAVQDYNKSSNLQYLNSVNQMQANQIFHNNMIQQQLFDQQSMMAHQAHVMGVNSHAIATMGHPIM